MSATVNIAGVDPGLASGGLVFLSATGPKLKVLAAHSLGEGPGARKEGKDRARELTQAWDGWPDLQFTTATLRAQAWMGRFAAAEAQFILEHGPIDFYAVESFVDQHQHAKQMMRDRWHAAYLTGMLVAHLSDREVSVSNGRLIFQNAGVVLPQTAVERAALKDKNPRVDGSVVEGDIAIRNEHERSAYGHALSLALRLNHRQTTNP